MVRKAAAILLIIFLAIAGYAAFSWFSAGKAVKDYCTDLKAETDLPTAKTLARNRGLRFGVSRSPGEKGHYTALVTNWGPHGRHVCVIEHDSEKVIRARLDSYD